MRVRFEDSPEIINDSDHTSQGSATDNFVEFGTDSNMPPILNLETAGLRRSPRLAAKKERPWYKCNLIAKCFCVLALATSYNWAPTCNDLHSSAEQLVFTTVNSFHSANQLFDDTLNSLDPMALVTQKEDNESYTFRQMLKQPDAAEFINAMLKETDDHESRVTGK